MTRKEIEDRIDELVCEKLRIDDEIMDLQVALSRDDYEEDDNAGSQTYRTDTH